MKKPISLLGIAFLVLSTLLIAVPVKANAMWVPIDIKPCSCPNSINPKSKGVVPVAVLSWLDTFEFYATTVDPETVEFHGVPPLRWAFEDVKSWAGPPDGLMDIVFHFKTQELVTADMTSSGEYILTGETFDGQPIQGSGWVNIVP